MIISDSRYGSELVTNKGKVLKFDSVECLAAFHAKQQISHDNLHSLWVVDLSSPGELIEAAQAVYLQSPNLHSPMGLNISAYANQTDAERIKREYHGELLNWNEVLSLSTNEKQINF